MPGDRKVEEGKEVEKAVILASESGEVTDRLPLLLIPNRDRRYGWKIKERQVIRKVEGIKEIKEVVISEGRVESAAGCCVA